MTSIKLKIRNKLLLLSMVVLLCSMLISWFFASGIFEILTMDYNAPDLVPDSKDSVQAILIWQVLTWEGLVDSALFYLFNYLPLFIVLPVLNFFQEKRGFFLIGRNRFVNFRQRLLSSSLIYALQGALGFSVSCTIFFSIGGMFVRRGLTDIGEFASIFPEGFYERHPYLFFLFMVWSIYFVLAFIFSFLACGLILLFEKEYQVLFAILVFYIGCNYLSGFTGSKFFEIFNAFGAFNTVSKTYEVFYVTLPLSLLAVATWLVGVRKTINTY